MLRAGLLSLLLFTTGCEQIGRMLSGALPAGEESEAGVDPPSPSPGARADGTSQPAGERPVGVFTEAVVLEAARTHVEAIGTARARASTVLHPAAGGEVQRIHFEAGQFVRKDAAVMDLDARREELAVKLAGVAVREAEQLLARYRRIEDTGAISDSQIDEARTRVEAAHLQMDQARVAHSERTLRAPFDGHLGLPAVDAGARVTPTTAITEIDDRSVLFVDFPAPEQVFGGIRIDMPVAVEAFAAAGTTREARVVAIGSRVDPLGRTFLVRAAIDNADDALRPGMSFRVRFDITDIAGAALPVVPEAAIVWGGDGPSLWVVREGHAVQVSARISERRAGRVLVEADLAAGERVIAEGVQKVRPGTPVTELARTPLPHAAAAGAGAARLEPAVP